MRAVIYGTVLSLSLTKRELECDFGNREDIRASINANTLELLKSLEEDFVYDER